MPEGGLTSSGWRLRVASMTSPRRHPASVSTGDVTPRLLNLKQAAVYLGLSYWTLRDYVLAGYIQTVDLPPLRPRDGDRPKRSLRRSLVDVRALDAFIDSRTTMR